MKKEYSIIVFKQIRETTEVGLQQAIRIQKAFKEEYGDGYRIIMKPKSK
jgi:hypothetical protein